jgi:DNA-binding transcriptional ArsR family regulator
MEPKPADSPLKELSQIDPQRAAHLAELFQALSDQSRVLIISALVNGPKNVSSIAEETGFSESSVSHYLRGVRLLRLVKTEKQGRNVFYHIDDQHVLDILTCGYDHVAHSFR